VESLRRAWEGRPAHFQTLKIAREEGMLIFNLQHFLPTQQLMTVLRHASSVPQVFGDLKLRSKVLQIHAGNVERFRR
jgi:hypothetical protein